MTREEKLAYAREMYPVGTKFLGTQKEVKEEFTITKDYTIEIHPGLDNVFTVWTEGMKNTLKDSLGNYAAIIYDGRYGTEIWAKKLNNVELEKAREIIYKD